MRPFRAAEPLTLDFDSLGPGLVALVGGNGEGKTTALEAPIATLFQQFASRSGALYDYATGKDAFLEATFENDGDTIRAQLQIDAEARRMEPYLFVNNEPVATGKAKPYKDAVARFFGSRDLVLCSVLAAQDHSGQFSKMTKGQRKDALMRMLGHDRIMWLYRASGEAARTARSIFETTKDRAARVLEAREGLPALEHERDSLIVELEGYEHTRDDAEARRDDALTRRREADSIKARMHGPDPKDALRALKTRWEGIERRLLDRKRSAQAVIRDRERIEHAADLVPDLEAQLKELEDRRAEDRVERVRIEAELTSAEHSLRELEGKLGRAQEAIRGYERQTGVLDTVPCAKAKGWTPQANTYGPGYADTHDLAGTCPLISQAQEARKVVERGIDPDLVQSVKDAVERRTRAREALHVERENFDTAIRETRKELEAGRIDAARFPEITRAAEEIERIAEERVREREQVDEERVRLEERIAEIDAIRKKYEACKPEAIAADLSTAERDFRAADAEVRRVQTRIVELNTRIDLHTETITKNADLVELADKREQDVREWELLRSALGPDGVPALEVDAAGPELASIANHLLEACYGSRFVIGFETQRDKLRGKGKTEVFDVVVYDGAERRTIEDLSGGEAVIVSEGLNLALAIYNARKSGVSWRTLWRDETAGALAPDNADKYVAMLRRALDEGGFEQIIFVAHLPAVWEAADVRLQFNEGRVQVI